MHVLLIEDNLGDVKVVEATLRRAMDGDYTLTHVGQISEAQEVFASKRPDVILLDLTLPDSSGLETIKRTQAFAKDVPIVVLTGVDEAELGAAAIRGGVQDYLSKALMSGELLSRSLRYAVERFRIEQEICQYRDHLEELVCKRTADLEDANDRLIAEISEREREHAEKERLQAQLRQQQKLDSIGTLASGVAHEINNPIMGIINYGRMLADTADEDSESREYACEITREGERVAAIVRNLLAFARQQEKVSAKPEHLHSIVENTLSLIRAIMIRDKITLEVSVAPELPQVLCRSSEIQQVIMNLVTNARDALNERYESRAEAKHIVVSAHMLFEEDKQWVRLTVEDFGNGIPKTILERVFDPFFTTKPCSEGTGLGLSVSHGIVQEHGGRLKVESEPGQFTRFHLDLPVAEEG